MYSLVMFVWRKNLKSIELMSFTLISYTKMKWWRYFYRKTFAEFAFTFLNKINEMCHTVIFNKKLLRPQAVCLFTETWKTKFSQYKKLGRRWSRYLLLQTVWFFRWTKVSSIVVTHPCFYQCNNNINSFFIKDFFKLQFVLFHPSCWPKIQIKLCLTVSWLINPFRSDIISMIYNVVKLFS